MNSSDTTSTFQDKLQYGIAGPIIIYGLFFGGLLHAILPIVGVVLAYYLRRDSLGYLQSHFDFLIRTFWIALGFCVGIFAVAVVLYFSSFKSLFSSDSMGSGLTHFSLNVVGFSIELNTKDPSTITTGSIIFIVAIMLLVLALLVWYLVRLGMGVRALYLGKEVP